MTIVNKYWSEPEAYIDMGMLRNHGLHPEVTSDALSDIFPAPGSGTGSIYLSVPDAEARQAEELLRNHND